MPQPRQLRPAFTLIELLVVISIIALLVAILLPTLTAARNTSRELVCLTQVRAFSQGQFAYHADEGTFVRALPSQTANFSAAGPPWHSYLIDLGYVTLNNQDTGRTEKNYEIQVCPIVARAHFGFHPGTVSNATTGELVRLAFNYTMNGIIGGYDMDNIGGAFTYQPWGMEQLDKPSNTMLIMERYYPMSGGSGSQRAFSYFRDNIQGGGVAHPQGSAPGQWTFRNFTYTGRTGTNNMAFADGSASAQRGRQVAGGVTEYENADRIIADLR